MIQRVAVLVMSVLLMPAAADAVAKTKKRVPVPKNGSWVGTSEHATYNIRVERHRVVAVFIEATPDVQAAEDGGACGTQYYGFTGTWTGEGNKTTPQGFYIAQARDYRFFMDGKFSSNRTLTGTLTLNASPDQSCQFSSAETFTATFNTSV